MPIAVINVATMRQWEQATWAAGRREEDVIRRVGHLVAQRMLELTRPGDLVIVLAGKGHNGDDARFASQHLIDREVYLINAQEPEPALAEFRSQLDLQPAWILDGLFGLGLNRPLSADWRQLIEAVNQSQIPILSVDVPSGLNAETGQPEGAAIAAAITLTLGAVKRGLLRAEASPYVGRLEVAPEIGLVARHFESDLQWSVAEDFIRFPPARPVESHKGDQGHLGILGGSVGYAGAVILAARGAARARPGLMTICTMPDAYLPVASQLQMQMVHPWREDFVWPENCTGLLAGPGLARKDLPEAAREQTREQWRSFPGAMVVDASALDWLPEGAISSGGPRVITPHPGEAGRLLQRSAASVQADRFAATRALSKKFANCWVALKGHQTVVGRAEGALYVNSSGNPELAQGGSGDLLSGYIAGFAAQPRLQSQIDLALRHAVWQHGAAADALSWRQRNWTVEDLIREMGNANANAGRFRGGQR